MEALKLEEAKWLFQDHSEVGIVKIRILSEVLLCFKQCAYYANLGLLNSICKIMYQQYHLRLKYKLFVC